MAFDRQTIRHLEDLARIELGAAEAGLLVEQLQRIVSFVEKLQSVDTTGVPPTGLMSPAGEDALRDDVVRQGLDRRTVLEQAPDTQDGFFRVPRVIAREDE